MSKTKISNYFYVFPATVVLLVFSVYPIFNTFWLSLTDAAATQRTNSFVGLTQYAKLFDDPYFMTVLGNTVFYCVCTVVSTIFFGLLFAAVANGSKNRFKGLLRISAFYPYMLPISVVAMVWIYMYNPARGLVNFMLGTRVSWLNNYEYSMLAIIIVTVWKSLGFNFLLFLSGMQNISPELYESASLDTSSSIKKFFGITLPMLGPTLFLTMLLSISSSFQSMDIVAIMTGGGPGNSTNVLMYYVYQLGIVKGDIGYGSAVSSILLAALLIFTIFYLKIGGKMVNYDR